MSITGAFEMWFRISSRHSLWHHLVEEAYLALLEYSADPHRGCESSAEPGICWSNAGTEMGGRPVQKVRTGDFRPLVIVVEPSTPIPLAVVNVDGGRIQTRTIDSANGVQDPHWRETKNALFMRMSGVSFEADPHPALPACFIDRNYMKKLLSGLAEVGDFAPQSVEETSKSDLRSWRLERLYRTCLSSLSKSKAFGRVMEAKADCRGFFKAAKQAFVCDELQYNWSIQQEHFTTFTPILDSPHAIECLHETAKALHPNSEKSWDVYVQWITAVWQGRVPDVLHEMKRIQLEISAVPKDCEDKDARKVLSEAGPSLGRGACVCIVSVLLEDLAPVRH
jgi:hypothetical protein